MYELGRLDIQDADVPDLKFSAVKTILKSPVSFYRILSHNLKRGELFVADMRSKNERLQNLDAVAMSEEKLLAHSAALTTDGIEIADGILYIATGLIAFPFLHKACSKWLGDKDGAIANKLMAGMGDMDSAEAGHDLWRLAKKANECPDVLAIIVSGKSWKMVRERLCDTNPGNDFLKSWDEFMIEHGHHCRGEMELSNPRWSETPDYILSLLREYIGGIDKADPVENHAKCAQRREQLTGHCRQRLKNPVRRTIFNYLLTRAQRGAVLRENWKSQGVRYIARFRTILIELGERLYTRGVLASPDDIFFLKLDEIQPVTQNKANLDVNKTIASRRAQYEKNKSLAPPPVVVGMFDPDNYVPEPINDNVEVLNGLAVSPGIVTGKARVILRADTDQQVLAGEILVAPFTDPGWTPYFVPAAAIVMDQGGLLSHGSIIAREYGIPAVVNVGPGTKIIKTGQTIQVDGNRGVVAIVR
jgi:pyruvate,water dikinase